MAAQAVVYEDLESGTPGIVGEEGHGEGEFTSPAAPAPATAPKQTAKQEAKDEDKQSPKELSAMRARIAELEASERYWADKAQKVPSPAAEPKKTDGPDELEQLLAEAGIEDDTAASLLDDIGEKGVAALQKRGVITKAQLKPILAAIERRMEAKAIQLAESRVEGAKGQLTAEAKLLQEFPDLQDPKSELSKAVAVEFAAMVAEEPGLKSSYTALRQAARLASLQHTKQADTRSARIKSQAPSRGAAPANEFDDDVEISPEAQQLINIGRRYGLSEDTYRAQAKANRRSA